MSRGYDVLSVTVVNHGSSIITQNGSPENIREFTGPEAFDRILETKPFRIMVDASHPFSEGISGQAKKFCGDKHIPYIRFVREEVELPESPLLFPVYSWEEAAEKAVELGGTIFLTTGSYNLELFLKYARKNGKRLVVRVLPDHHVIEKVRALEVAPRDIVAMQGPFSKEMNRATFKMYNASVIVTKDSGKAGGTESKISAALSLRIPVVIIKRPRLNEKTAGVVNTYEQVLENILQLFDRI